jgi:hypothetical protein
VLHQFGFYLISLIYYFNVAPELSTFSFAVFDIFGIYLVSMDCNFAVYYIVRRFCDMTL